MEVKKLPFGEFAQMYCETQEQTPEGLREILAAQAEKYSPEGWFMIECHMMDSTYLGTRTILPYGPNNTFKAPPDHPVSPRGLASDMSVVIAALDASELDPKPEDKKDA